MLPSPTRVLLVEDSSGDATIVKAWLDDIPATSFEVTVVGYMRDAIEHLKSSGVDVVLLDLGLPDANGLDSVQQMHDAAPNVPLIIMTGTDDESTVANAIEIGAQDYLVKDYVNDQLLSHSIKFAVERQRLLNEKFIDLKTAVQMLSRRKISLEGVNLDGWDLRGMNFQRATLNGASLKGAMLNAANFQQAEMHHVVLDSAKMEQADLQWADVHDSSLKNANMTRASLRWTNLTNTMLDGAVMKDAFMQGAKLSGTNLETANVTGAYYDDETEFPDGFDPDAANMVRRD
ncbi:MAG: pentapeptide repeat-containing protein [Candidatus Poribacteria bacterium]|nr:pentapeptide repeat-containing protein [Candidatus Poribacteria bacterium]